MTHRHADGCNRRRIFNQSQSFSQFCYSSLNFCILNLKTPAQAGCFNDDEDGKTNKQKKKPRLIIYPTCPSAACIKHFPRPTYGIALHPAKWEKITDYTHPSKGFLTLDQLRAVSRCRANIQHNFISINHKRLSQTTGKQVEGGNTKAVSCLTH